jgi:hypothetical protein
MEENGLKTPNSASTDFHIEWNLGLMGGGKGSGDLGKIIFCEYFRGPYLGRKKPYDEERC